MSLTVKVKDSPYKWSFVDILTFLDDICIHMKISRDIEDIHAYLWTLFDICKNFGTFLGIPGHL